MFSIRIYHGEIFDKFLGKHYVDGQVDIFDTVDILVFNKIELDEMVLQLDYTGETEHLFYNYLRPLGSLYEGLYLLACNEDVRCLAMLVISFKLLEVFIEHGYTIVNSCQRPPPQGVKATTKNIGQPNTSTTKKNKSYKLFLLTWHDSSTHDNDSICDFVTPSSMPHGLLTQPTDESVVTLALSMF
nr:hypothetical protein [Tanacetum cinerariifolium]